MLAIRPRRYRTSTSASVAQTTKGNDVLRGLLDSTANLLQDRPVDGYPHMQSLLDETRKLHQHIAAQPPPCSPQDDFRHLRGFHQLLEILRSFSGFYNPQKRTDAEKRDLFDLLHIILAVLSAAFRGHPGNRRYFQDRVEGGGWESLEQVIASIGLGGSDSDPWTNLQLFGKLFSFALDDQRLDELCRSFASAAEAVTTAGDTTLQGKAEEVPPEQPAEDQAVPKEPDAEALHLARIESELRGIIGSKTTVRNSEIIRTVIGFWESIPRTQGGAANPASMVVLVTLSLVSEASFFNMAALHASGTLSRFLRLAFADPCPLADAERDKILPLCQSWMCLGVNQLADTQFLLSRQDPTTSEFCLEMTTKYNGPSSIQFDLSLNGHASVELPSLGRTFPRQAAAGYTFAAWVRIERFDPKSHTTLFGVFDSSQTCFLLAYLERDTRNFILQTSVTSSRPSVRFKSVTFKEKRWYHIAVVHKRAKTMTASKASLFVNGEFSEQLRASYPNPPPVSNGSTESFASLSSSTSKTSAVQAFLGTPRDLSSQLGPGLILSKWSLASAHLIEDVLSDDLLAVYFRLGPRYQGNFQDSLGGFQTYEASSALGLRNEFLHPGKDEKSDIIRAMRDKAGTIVPEHKVAFSILPQAVFRANGSYLDSALFRCLSRASANSLMSVTTKNGTPVAINGAVPCINDALLRPHGVALLSGDPVVSNPYHFDDNLWRLGGFTPIALKLVERAGSGSELLRSVELILRCIDHSWRNSESVEKSNGYAILSMLFRAKLGHGSLENPSWRLPITPDERDKLGFQLLSLVLQFVGYNHANPLESSIVNPLAYRNLLIDTDTWRKSAPMTQELYYKQFVTFAVQSKYHQFNSRRLLRMRIVKRLLDAIKEETVSEDILPHFMASFESLAKSNFYSEVHRSLALFITYSFHTPSTWLARRPKPPASRSGMTVTVAPASSQPTSGLLSRKQLGVKILEMYTRLLCERDSTDDIRRFAKTVTNKVILEDTSTKAKPEVHVLTSRQWLLYLLAEDDPEIVVYGCKILARLLVTQPLPYCAKFANKTGGFAIMTHRLKQWWDIRTLWPLLFSILFGYDVAKIDFDKPFDFFSLYEIFGNSQVRVPGVLPVITTMLLHGLRDILKYQDDPETPGGLGVVETAQTRPRARSMELGNALEPRRTQQSDRKRIISHAGDLKAVVQFLADMQANSASFRDFALSSDYIRLLLSVLYPVIVSADAVSPEVELTSKDSVLNFEGGDVMIRPVPGSTWQSTPIVRTATATPSAPLSPSLGRGTPLRRTSSFILVTSQSPQTPSPARLTHVMSPKKKLATQHVSNVVLQGLLDLITGVFTDQMLKRKEFSGFGLFVKVPPGFQEHQAFFDTYILRNTITQLRNAMEWDQQCLSEPKVLQNLGRFSLHMVEAIFEGWFLNGAEAMLDFTGFILEYLQRPDVAAMKSVRLCSPAVGSIRAAFLKLILLRLSDMDDGQTSDLEADATMEKMLYWQTVLLNCLSLDDDFMKLVWYQLYNKLVDSREHIRLAAASLWRILLVQKPDESATLFRQCTSPDQQVLIRNFRKFTEEDNHAFIEWIDRHRPSLDILFFGGMSKTWEEFVSAENCRTTNTATSRLKSRKDKLKQWHAEEMERDNMIMRHEMANNAWKKSIYHTEHFKHQRNLQDQQDDNTFMASALAKMTRDLGRPGGVFAEQQVIKWKLDRTEGRNRMRLRLLPDYPAQQRDYQPKRKMGDNNAPGSGLELNTAVSSIPSLNTPSTPTTAPPSAVENTSGLDIGPELEAKETVAPEDDFEFVADPNEDETFEDKNRKVMRRLKQGDTVQSVYNMSRIIGLDACEGILIIGKESLYMMDNLFQRVDGEIVNVWQASPEERDPFSVIITGGNNPGLLTDGRPSQKRSDQESRAWAWQDVLSISKRRFLFRDVAIEIFFTDGRSYLLTTVNPSTRDGLFARLISKTPHTAGPNLLPNPDDAWRLEGLKFTEEGPQTFGAKFGSMFNSSAWNPLMRRWQKGEISNFQYLMLVNTMAGRTFNDLTQYPVFPWVLADYTGEILDLNDPATFRDLSKPMGAQSTIRALDIHSKYKTMTEMGDTPYHYGTHYSSAMIVSSYLIRLPPFVQSFILMQGGSFDHPDRLFHSIEGAWKSASGDTSGDVRELIPEFFYLPELLSNINGYNFGVRQGNRGSVNNVELPPWAKGDPKVFIEKHREALESPYVSQRLHQWIDLVFGYKQRGEAAFEALNVFHPLSYRGATDLDNITDPQERAVITNIIHNFGQTPQQVFPRAHPAREHDRCPIRRLDTSVYALTKLPQPLLESHERVSSLIYAPKLDRLLCTSPFRLNLPPHYDKFLEWGFADHSLRFYMSDNRKPAGIFENMHIGQLSTLTFADSKTLVTAGEDCVVSVYSMVSAPGKPVELLHRSSLFGHKTPVTTIAVAKSLSTFVTVSQDGTAMLWDLNRLEFIRKLPMAGRAVECARIHDATGDIMLCSGPNVALYTLNGDLVLDQNVCGAEGQDDYVHACAFYEGAADEWCETYLVFTGHKRGRVNVWRKTVGRDGRWILEFMRALDHADPRSETGANVEAAITCITPMPQLVYTGDDDGRVYEWNLIQRER